MKLRVLRPFDGMKAGDVVDAEKFSPRNLVALIDQGRVKEDSQAQNAIHVEGPKPRGRPRKAS